MRVVTLVFTEFGRRVQDNGGGTDHGTAGGAFVIGNAVNGGLFGDYPSLKPGHLRDGEDLEHSYDLRGLYATLLEQWMGLDATPFVGRDVRTNSRVSVETSSGQDESAGG